MIFKVIIVVIIGLAFIITFGIIAIKESKKTKSE